MEKDILTMNSLIIDFETYYNTEDNYSVKSKGMVNTLYIHDERFEIIMASVIYNDGNPQILKGWRNVRDYLHTLDLNKTVVVSHTKFDLAIIQLALGIKIPYTSDTDALSRVYGIGAITNLQSTSLASIGELFLKKRKVTEAKGTYIADMDGKRLSDLTPEQYQKYAEYCIQDTVITHKIWKGVAYKIPHELKHINITNQMYINHHFSVDVPLLEANMESLLQKRKETAELLWASLPRNADMLEFIKKNLGKLNNKTYMLIDMNGKSKRHQHDNTTTVLGRYLLQITESDSEYKLFELLSLEHKLLNILKLVNCKDMFLPLIMPEVECYCKIYDISIPTKIPKNKTEKTPDLTKNNGFFSGLVDNTLRIDYKDYKSFEEVVSSFVYKLCEFKLYGYNGLAYTRAEKFIKIGKITHNNHLTVALSHARAHTLRYGGEEINLQNLPARTNDLTLKRSIIAPEGKILLDCDSAQIEARVLPWLCNHQRTLDMFRTGRDLYCDTAAAIFGKTYEEIFTRSKLEPDEEGVFMRTLGKITSLAAQFGTGANRLDGILFAHKVKLPSGLTPKYLVDVYRESNPEITGMWNFISNVIIPAWINGEVIKCLGTNNDAVIFDGARRVLGERVPSIILPNNTPLCFPQLRYEKREKNGYIKMTPIVTRKDGVKKVLRDVSVWGGLVLQNITQGYAFASIMREQMLNIHNRGVPIALNLHDAVASSVQEHDLRRSIKVIIEEMNRSPEYCKDLPLSCELDVGYNMADMITVYKDGKYMYNI